MSPEQPSARTTVIVPDGADSRSPQAVNPSFSGGIGKRWSWPDLLLKVVIPLMLVAAPVAICLAFVNANAVNVPFLDEWSYLQYVEKFLEGKLNLAEFVNVQHNEHKVCVPFSIMLLVSAISRQNSIALMYLSVGIIFLQCLCLVGIGWPRVRGRANSLLLLTPVFWLMFSLRNWENLLWGHQAHLLTCGFLIVLTVFLLDRANRSAACFVLALAAALGATFSMGNGVVIWPLGLFQLVFSGFSLLEGSAKQRAERSALAAVSHDGSDPDVRGDAREESALHQHRIDFNRRAWVFRLTAWATVGAVTLAYYLHTLTLRTSPGAAACRLSLEKLKRYPCEVGQYLLACLGGACSASPDVAISGGLLIVFLLASGICSIWVAPPAIRERACAPLTLFLFSLASALLILAGRFGGGLDSALQSRYCSFTSIGLAGLYLLLLSFGRPKSTFEALRLGMLVGLFCIATIAGWRSGAIAGEQVRGARVVYSNMVRFIDLQSDDGLAELFSDPSWIRARAAYLRSHHLSLFAEGPPVALSGLLRVTAPAPSFLLESINSEPSHTYPLQRSVVVDSSKTPSLNFRGWSVDFPARGPSRAVFVSIDSTVDIPTGTGIPRPEVAAQYRRRSFLHSGFGGTCRTDLIAKGLHVVTLKIVSPDGHSYFQTGPLATLEIK